MKSTLKKAAFSFACLLTLAIAEAPAANARRVAVDDPWPSPSAGFCMLNPGFGNSDCNAVSLGFQVGNAGQAYSSLHIYDDGLVSFGGPVGNWLANSPGDFGTPVIISGLDRILYDEDIFALTTTYSRVAANSAGGITIDWFEGFPAFVGGTYIDDDGNEQLIPGSYAYIGTDKVYQSLTLQPLANGKTRATVTNLRSVFDEFGQDYILPVEYALANVTNIEDLGAASYSFEFGAAVPEPASWAMLIAGFGLVGGALRARRSQAA